MKHAFVIGDDEHEAWLSRRNDGYTLHFGDRAVPVALQPSDRTLQTLLVGDESDPVLVAADGEFVHVYIGGATFAVRTVDPVQRYAGHSGAGIDDVAEAPMPGVVIAVHVREDQPVIQGDTLMVVESMKLETAIKAWRDGTIAAIHVEVGQTFQRGAALLTFAPQAGA